LVPGEPLFPARTTGIAPETGLGWRAQSRSRLVRLTLTYQRALGTTRIKGLIVLRKLRVTQAQLTSHDVVQSCSIE
jgi:hypothetical protein